MAIETQLLREVVNRVIKARDSKIVLDVNATALALSRKYSHTKMSVAEIRSALKKAAETHGAALASEKLSRD